VTSSELQTRRSNVGSFTRSALTKAGFSGFVTFDSLREGGIKSVPTDGGAYVVLRERDDAPRYLEASIGGWFKKRDPTVDASVLAAKWLEGCHVVYIGKAKSLKDRLGTYMKFGAGKPIGHWGGRYIWQLADSADLLVAWRACRESETPPGLESELVREFRKEHGGLPFANIADPS
jgi:hypothetical protein